MKTISQKISARIEILTEMKPLMEKFSAVVDELLEHNTFSCFCSMPDRTKSIPALKDAIVELGLDECMAETLVRPIERLEEPEYTRCLMVDNFLEDIAKHLEHRLLWRE